MEFALSDDQTAILGALESLARPYATMPSDCHGFVLTDAALDRELAEGGFLDVAADPDLGAVAGALVIEQLARLPYAVEVAASALIRPLLGEVARPVCVLEADRPGRPLRFLAPGATVVVLRTDRVAVLTAEPADVTPVASLYAYPMGLLAVGAVDRAAPVEVDPAILRARWQVALAGEIAGLLAAAIASTVTYVGERKQFGRPIGTFQAMRHRLAEAHVLATGTRWLALRAAGSGNAGEAALALGHAQEAATRITYDLHQFLAGMGMTLEHPLHLWTYRLKALLSDLGGGLAQAGEAAGLIWAERAA